MRRGLVVGYGNVGRRDDGIAWHVINRLATLLGREPFAADEAGIDDLGNHLDLVLTHQLMPELAEVLALYDVICFVAAAGVGEQDTPQRWQPLDVNAPEPCPSHHLDPPTLLLLAEKLYGQRPQAVLLLIRGHRFEPGNDLSPETAAQVEPAAWRILQWMREAGVLFTLPLDTA